MRIISAEQYNRGFSEIRFYKLRIAEGGKYATCFVNNQDDEVIIVDSALDDERVKQFARMTKTRVVS